jgi:general secretion pathway protein G
MLTRPTLAARAGYTLIEIMLVLSIIMLLLGTGIFFMSKNTDYAKIVAAQASVKNFETALKGYEMIALNLPTSDQGLMALYKKPESEPRPSRWSQQITDVQAFQDPWRRPFQYRYPGKHNPQSFDVYSFGPDGVESEDDIGNWAAGS